MRSVMQLICEAHDQGFAVAPEDQLRYAHSCKKVQQLQRKPQPEFINMARRFGSASPSLHISQRYKQPSGALKTDFVYNPRPILPERNTHIRPRVFMPSEAVRSPPVGKYNVEAAFSKLKSARSALISNYEEVQHQERRPIAYFYPNYSPQSFRAATMRSDRKILLHDRQHERVPSPNAYSPSRRQQAKLCKLEANLVAEDRTVVNASLKASIDVAARMMTPEYIQTGHL